MSRLRIPDAWRSDFDGVPGAVFAARDVGDAWAEVASELDEAFLLARDAARDGTPMAYVVHHDDLLGRRGPGRAMVATGILSAARTAAVEQAKARIPVNVIAVDDGIEPATIARWARILAEGPVPTGELVRLGASHLGKALP